MKLFYVSIRGMLVACIAGEQLFGVFARCTRILLLHTFLSLGRNHVYGTPKNIQPFNVVRI